MEFHQLRYFVAAAEELSVSRAAEKLHVTQPALSRQIAVLEDELGVPLFDRIKKRIHLTDAGRFFLPRARQLICDAETGAQQVREQFGNASRTLRLGFLPIFLDDLVAPAVREFRQRHPKTQVSLFELSPRAQLQRLRAHELDAAILGNLEETDKQQFVVKRLSRNPMAAVLPGDHLLASRKTIKLGQLARERWISLSDALYPGRRELMRRVCGEAGFEPDIVCEVDSLSLMLGAIATGDGVGILPIHTRKLPHAGCAFVKLAAPVPATDLYMLTPRGESSLEMATLTSLILEHAARVAQQG